MSRAFFVLVVLDDLPQEQRGTTLCTEMPGVCGGNASAGAIRRPKAKAWREYAGFPPRTISANVLSDGGSASKILSAPVQNRFACPVRYVRNCPKLMPWRLALPWTLQAADHQNGRQRRTLLPRVPRAPNNGANGRQCYALSLSDRSGTNASGNGKRKTQKNDQSSSSSARSRRVA
jgi:hypothetical protein